MPEAEPRHVIDAEGHTATIVGRYREAAGEQERVLIELDDGARYSFSADLLVLQSDGEYHLRHTFAEIRDAAQGVTTAEHRVLPVVTERLAVGKREHYTTVRLTKRVREHAQDVSLPLFHEEAEVERVEVNKPLKKPAKTRQEGDTLIVPVMEEIVEVTKRLILREELHVTKRRHQEEHREQVILRSEYVDVERLDDDVRDEVHDEGGGASV